MSNEVRKFQTQLPQVFKNAHVRQAFEKALAKDKQITKDEVAGIFLAGARNNKMVPGDHDMDSSELRDYIWAPTFLGNEAFGPGARKAYNEQLETYGKMPCIFSAQTGTPFVGATTVALNSVLFSQRYLRSANDGPAGSSGRSPGGGTALLSVGDHERQVHDFEVKTSSSMTARDIANAFAKAIRDSGGTAKVDVKRGGSFLRIESLGSSTPDAKISNITTDATVRMNPAGSQVMVSSDGYKLAGGRIGLQIGNDYFAIATSQGGDVEGALRQLQTKVKNAGYDVNRRAIPTFGARGLVAANGVFENWTITPSKTRTVERFSFTKLSGTIERTAPTGTATHLRLDRPIVVDGFQTTQIALPRSFDGMVGKGVVLSGRVRTPVLIERQGPPRNGDSTSNMPPFMPRVSLDEITNLSDGFPEFDGVNFYDNRGNPLQHGVELPYAGQTSGPMFVFDTQNRRAFSGRAMTHAGLQMYGMETQLEIGRPSKTDIGNILWGPKGPYNRTTNTTLTSLKNRFDAGSTIEYYVDRSVNRGQGGPDTIYGIDRAGYPGLKPRLVSVIRGVPPEMVVEPMRQ